MINRHNCPTCGWKRSNDAPQKSIPARSRQKSGPTSEDGCSQSLVLIVRTSFHPEATAELETSAEWYAKQSTTVARDFLIAVDSTLESIETDPERFALIDDRHRSCSVQKFPFQVIFRSQDDRLHIIAIAHAKRRPGYWIGR
ncbi:MAG: hypothetical protein CMJ78_21275 [Planctomycetaceae bacterium]|nr:hypothetical protein [Planctomycetaceae bacterium]